MKWNEFGMNQVVYCRYKPSVIGDRSARISEWIANLTLSKMDYCTSSLDDLR